MIDIQALLPVQPLGLTKNLEEEKFDKYTKYTIQIHAAERRSPYSRLALL